MASITYDQLKTKIFERLGDEFESVEISDNQFQHIVDEATDEYCERHHAGTTPEIYILSLTDGTFEYTLPSYVKSVVGYYETSNQSYPSIRRLIYEYNPDIVSIDLISYSMFDAYMKTTDIITGIRHDFNYNDALNLFQIKNLEGRTSIALKIYKSIADSNAEYMYGDQFFQRWVEALCLIQWARNWKKFDRPLLGGATLNWRELEADGKEMLEQLREELKNDEIDPIGIYFG